MTRDLVEGPPAFRLSFSEPVCRMVAVRDNWSSLQLNPMTRRLAVCCAAWLATILLAYGQSESRRYEITSGAYYLCCGITGRPDIVQLPSRDHAFVELAVSRTSVTMTFLNREFRPVSRLRNGSVRNNTIHFRQRTRHPYYPLVTAPAFADYTVALFSGSLRLSGSVTSAPICCDIPTTFRHQRVRARLVR